MLLVMMASTVWQLQAQKRFIYPKTAFGGEFECGFGAIWGVNYDGADEGLNIVFKGVFEYSPKQWFGIVTGLGLDFRLYRWDGAGFYNVPRGYNHRIGAIQVPLQLQVRAGKSFVFEPGVEFGFIVSNERDDWPFERDVWETKPIDVVGVFAFRFRLYKGLSIGAKVRYGLAPFEERVEWDKRYGRAGDSDWASKHYGLVINIRYMLYNN